MEGNDFSKMIKDVEGLTYEEWVERYPNFSEWLECNGFRYIKTLDTTQNPNKNLGVVITTYCKCCNMQIEKKLETIQ